MHLRPTATAVLLAGVALISAACSGSGGSAAPTPAATPAANRAASTSATPSRTTGRPTDPAGDWLMYHRTLDHAGVATAMPAVTRVRVDQNLQLDRAMYASPVVTGTTVIAATEGNTVYAFGIDGAQRWRRTLGTPSPASERPCGNIDPLGITGTPVIVGSTVYVATELSSPVRHELVALDVATGAVRWRRTLDLPGTETVAMQQRAALTVTDGRVWTAFGGLSGDCGGYRGRLVGYALDGSGAPVSYTVPTRREAGMWAASGPVVDAAGRLFVAVGNGASGAGDPYDHSDSVLALDTGGRLTDSFSPTTWASDNDADLDLGSQGPALVGPWVFIAGKSSTAFVLRRDHLGGIGGEVSQADVCPSYGGTAVVGDVVYVPCDDGVRAVRIDRAGTMHVLWHAAPKGSPVVGGDRVWTLDPDAGVLYALDPATGAVREQVEVGPTSRFASPAISGSDVLVPTMSGLVVVATS